MSSRKKGGVGLRSRQRHQEHRQWVGFGVILIMVVSVIIAVMLAMNN